MTERTETEKMLLGELYLPSDPALVEARRRARRLCRLFNASTEDEPERRAGLLAELFGAIGPGAEVEPPFSCDYGRHIVAGERLYMNFGCVLLDAARITLGDRVLLGPGVHIYGATHPTDAGVRTTGRELAAPVTVGNDVWIGGGTIVCPGVTIGDRCVIGAGSVVTRSIPADHVAVGNPCRVVRRVDGGMGAV